VTGHRDLRDQDLPRLEAEVGAIIMRLRRDYLGREAQTPIIILSGLAEGADRLVARAALAQGAHLIAPLPMPLDEYRRDFEPGLTPGNMAEFDALFAQAIAAPVMPLQQGSTLEALRTDQARRNEQYRALGIFITQHCHVLLALWDGNDKEMSPGGTAEVVTFKRAGIPLMVSGSPRASLDASEIGPVIEVTTPRVKEASTATEINVRPWGKDVIRRHRGGTLQRAWRYLATFIAHVFRRELEPERSKLAAQERHELETWENFTALIELTRQFNRDAAALTRAANGEADIDKSLSDLFTDPDGEKGIDENAKKQALEGAPLWCRLYAVADRLAQMCQREFKRDWTLLFALGFVAFLCFALFTHAGYVGSVVLLVAYFAVFVAIFAVSLRALLGRHQERFLDYRALAEALRIAVYWKLVGIGARQLDAKTGMGGDARVEVNPVGPIASAYPIKQPNELAWVKICLRTLEPADKPQPLPPHRVDPAGHPIAQRYWVYGQFLYFRRQGMRHNRVAQTMEARSTLLAILSPFVFLPLLLYLLVSKSQYLLFGIDLQHVILLVVGLLAGIAAALSGLSERLAYKPQARQYDRMRTLFERACELLPGEIDASTASLAHALYHELGIEAMKENAEWVTIYRQRPIRPLH
jgi:hypothetical protein